MLRQALLAGMGDDMQEAIAIITLLLAGGAAVLSLIGLVVILRNRPSQTPLTAVAVADLLRVEGDRQRQAGDEQSRSLRQELADSARGFQETTLKAFTDLGQGLGQRINDFGTRLDTGIKAIDDRAAQIGTKLDADMKHMGEEAGKNRDALRQSIEAKLDDSAGKQATASRELREEVSGAVKRLQDVLIASAQEQRKEQGDKFDGFAQRLSTTLGEMNQRNEDMKTLLAQSLLDLANASDQRHQSMVAALDGKLKDMIDAQGKAAAAMREEIANSVTQLGATTKDTLTGMGQQQKERLDAVVMSLNLLSEKHEKAHEGLRQTVETKLDAIRTENTGKLDEIRKTVDEQLQTTLNERITSSFQIVHDRLEQVHRGLGEMQQLAGDVGDLKRVLANVKTRGVFGEVQLGSLMEQVFSAEQYVENAQVRTNSQERVEFALKIPGRSGEGDVLLPIDAKFPIEDYSRLVEAAEKADAAGVDAAAAQLEVRIRLFAKDIRDKYINPPTTTDIAILFLPTEGLHAEVLRRPGLIETIQETHHVVVAGPTTLMAILCAFRMSIRAVAIQKRSTEVWQILGAVRSEFDKHGGVLARLQRQLEASLTTVDTLGTRTRAMKRRLQGVDSIGTDKIEEVLGLPPVVEEAEADAEATGQ